MTFQRHRQYLPNHPEQNRVNDYFGSNPTYLRPDKKGVRSKKMKSLDITGRRERIRTSDPFVPNEMRYQAALHAATDYSSQSANTVNARIITYPVKILDFGESFD